MVLRTLFFTCNVLTRGFYLRKGCSTTAMSEPQRREQQCIISPKSSHDGLHRQLLLSYADVKIHKYYKGFGVSMC